MPHSLLYGLVLASVEGLADSAIKTAATTHSSTATWIGLLLYNVLAALLYVALRFGKLWKVNAYWDVLSYMLDLWIGVFFFKESVKPKEWFGFALAFVGILFML